MTCRPLRFHPLRAAEGILLNLMIRLLLEHLQLKVWTNPWRFNDSMDYGLQYAQLCLIFCLQIIFLCYSIHLSANGTSSVFDIKRKFLGIRAQPTTWTTTKTYDSTRGRQYFSWIGQHICVSPCQQSRLGIGGNWERRTNAGKYIVE